MSKKNVRKELEKSLGKEKVFTEKEYLVTYSYDATGNEGLPDLVVLPESERDIENTLKIAFPKRFHFLN